MKKLFLIAALAVCGCTSTYMIDIYHGDRFGYRTWCWATPMEERCAEMEARIRLYGWDAREHYPTNVCHRIEILYYDEGREEQTNVNKRVRYWIWGEGRDVDFQH